MGLELVTKAEEKSLGFPIYYTCEEWSLSWWHRQRRTALDRFPAIQEEMNSSLNLVQNIKHGKGIWWSRERRIGEIILENYKVRRTRKKFARTRRRVLENGGITSVILWRPSKTMSLQGSKNFLLINRKWWPTTFLWGSRLSCYSQYATINDYLEKNIANVKSCR